MILSAFVRKGVEQSLHNEERIAGKGGHILERTGSGTHREGADDLTADGNNAVP